MAWRVAASLATFRDQVNAYSPKRNRASDGTIGDAAHARSTSDHNPWIKDAGLGVVSALDITHSPSHGVDTWWLAEHLRQKRDPRIKYVISNHRIFSATVSPWQWRRYTGSNPHASHVHVSVNPKKALYDDKRAWDLGWDAGAGEDNLRPVLRKGSQGDYVRELQLALGDLRVDGGFGDETERRVIDFQRAMDLEPDGIVGPRTWEVLDSAAAKDDKPESRPVLRRGSTGEYVRIVQQLLMVPVDGQFGPITEREVRVFQTSQKLAADAVVGPQTWKALDGIEQLPRPLDYDEPMQLSQPIASMDRELDDEVSAPLSGPEDVDFDPDF